MMALRARFFVLAWALWACLMPVNGWAADRILELAHWEDKTAAVSFEQLPQVASFKPYDTILNKGFTDAADWVRVKIAARQAGEPEQLVLVIRPVYLDRIELYDPVDKAQSNKVRAAGDTVPWKDSEFESIHHTFIIPALSQERYVWLRLTTTSTHALNVQVLTPKEMLLQESKLLHVYAALLAGLVVVLILVLLAWARDRDAIIGYFVLRQVITFIYTASFFGYHRFIFHESISEANLNSFYSWLVLLMPGLTFIFEYRFLSQYSLPNWAKGLMWLITALVCVSPVAMGLGWVRESLQMGVVVVGLIGISIFVVSLSIQTRSVDRHDFKSYLLPKSVVCLYYGVIFFILILFVLPALGVIKASIWTVYGVLFYGVSSGVFMTVLLIVRSQKMESLRLEMSQNLLKSQADLSAETMRRQDQSRLLSMLMHEIKTPLSVIDMAMRRRGHEDKNAGYVERAIDNMKEILDRCVQTDRMMDGKFELQIQTVNLTYQLLVWVGERKEAANRFELNLLEDVVVATDLQCLQIIVNNLLENAFKHGHSSAPLTVSLKTNQAFNERLGVQIEICNLPGPSGWPNVAQLFDKYYRSSQAQRQSGTGLGLYLSYNLASQLGGSLRYRTAEGRIIFDLWLPS